MWIFNTTIGKVFSLILFPFQKLSPWIGMIITSLLTGLLMLLIFRYTSNQAGIKKTKDRIKAHLLEMRLFQDNLSASLKAQGNILLANFRYMSYSLKPLLVMIIPVILILIQMHFWFSYDSLGLKQEALLKIKLEDDINPLEVDMKIDPSPVFNIEAPPVRIEEENEIDWRFSANEPGNHTLRIIFNGEILEKTVSVGQRPLTRISPKKIRSDFLQELLYPTEAPLGKTSPVESIDITYPSKSMSVFGIQFHWIIAFFALSIIFGFSLKGFFGVEI